MFPLETLAFAQNIAADWAEDQDEKLLQVWRL